MQVVILAAGKGERLWPFTKNTPKCLLEIGHGLTLLEAQILAIKEVGGVDEVALVTGYLADQVDAKLKAHAETIPVRTIYNPFYDQSNNLVSLWLASQSLGEEFVVINGDDLFKPDVLRALLDARQNDAVTMVIDRKSEYDEDDMKVQTDGGAVVRVGKDTPMNITNGESIGMIHFHGRGAAWLREQMDSLLRDGRGMHGFWLHALQGIMDAGKKVRYVECDPDDWREMDFHLDRKMVEEALHNHEAVLGSWLDKK